jgi:hypothetical protein
MFNSRVYFFTQPEIRTCLVMFVDELHGAERAALYYKRYFCTFIQPFIYVNYAACKKESVE